MSEIEPASSDDDRRVVSFRPGLSGGRKAQGGSTPVEDLTKYQNSDIPDDYRHRMMVNIAAFGVIAALIGGGIWLADQIAQLRQTQDCVAMGRRNCAPLDFPSAR